MLLPDTESRTVNTPDVFMSSVSRSSSRSPASTRPTMTNGAAADRLTSGAMTFAAAENPGIRSTPFFSIASCDHTSGTLMDDRATDRDRDHRPALRKVCELRGAARSLRELDLQLLLQPFPLDERQAPVGHLLTETLRDLGFGEHEWPDGKGTIELIAIDLVLAEIQLIVDDVEDGRIQDFIDAEGAVVRIAAGFGGRKREMELR